jgi:Mg2+-importing ATPase
MATQVLVVFVIRTVRPAWASRPHIALTVTALTGLAAALVVPFLPAANLLGFAAPGGAVIGAIALLVVAYLASAELLKRFALRSVTPGTSLPDSAK